MILVTKSPEDTRELAAQLAGVAKAGDVILLTGELGAGKTTFAQGFGRALGIMEPITSPTFTLVRHYDEGARVPMLHADMYRLDRVQEVLDLGLPELIDDGRVALVEWGEVATAGLPPEHLSVRIEFGEHDDDRIITMTSAGSAWAARASVVGTVLGRWQQEPPG